MSGHTIVRAGVDAYVDQLRPSTNYSNGIALYVGGAANQALYSYLYFHNPTPKSATVTSATLRFYTRGTWPGGNLTISLQRIAAAAKFSQLNWTKRPGVTGSVVAVVQAGSAQYTLWEFNVTALIQTIANGAPNYGFRLSSTSAARLSLWSLNASHHRPTLEVAWSDAPQAPTSLVPSGGQVTSLTKPVLQFDYTDVGGNTDIAALQVQIDPAANWTAPAWDSGVVTVQDPELDLAATAYPGLGSGAVTYWRVRVQDGAGLWSRWSARTNGVGAKMQRVTKGSLALLSPGNNGVLDDWSPPVAWQLTGRGQRWWRIVLTTTEDPTEWLYTTGRRSGADTAFTIPYGYLTDWGTQYRIWLDVWDGYDRVATPGDPAYVRVYQDFVLVDYPGVGAPDQLSGSSDPDGRPYLHLRWHRDDAPDAWNILRDGKAVATGIYGPDLLTGTAEWYAYTDKDASPNTPHDWSVQAVVNRQNSRRPTWTGQVDSVHAWLIDWATDRLLAIMDPDITFDMPEIAATYEPIARNTVVRVVQQQRGVEGTITGRLVGFPGTGLTAQENNLLWMKRRPTRAYRLMVGNQTWRVLLGEVVLSPMRIPDSAASAVSLSFWSIDGPP